MNKQMIDFMSANGFTCFVDEGGTELCYVKIFKMCPHCGNTWTLTIIKNTGEWSVSNEFGQTCWENGHHSINPDFQIGRLPWVNYKEIPQKVETVYNILTLIEFVDSYKHY